MAKLDPVVPHSFGSLPVIGVYQTSHFVDFSYTLD